MKKIIFIICAIFLISSSFAFDFGGSLHEDFSITGISSKDILTINNIDFAFRFKTPIDFQGNTNLNLEVAYMTNSSLTDFAFNQLVDIRKVNLSMKIPLSINSNCIFLMGRDSFSDISGLIFNDKIDQLSFKFDLNFGKISLLVGYTGLLNGNTHKTIFDPPISENEESKIYQFTKSPSIVMNGRLQLKDILDFSPITVEFLSINNLALGNYTNNYINVYFKKPIFKKYNLTAFSSFLFKQETSMGKPKLANLSKLNFSYEKDAKTFAGKVLFASNDSETFSAFQQYSVVYTSKFLKLPLSNQIVIGGQFSKNFANNSLFSFDADFYYSFNQQESKLKGNGIELKLTFDVQTKSDLKIFFELADFISSDFSSKEHMNQFYFDFGMKLFY